MSSTQLVLGEHKDQFASIGVDLFRNEADSSIWRVEQGEDGIDYVVRTNIADELTQIGSSSDWKTIANRDSSSVTLFYKNTPVKKFDKDTYGFNKETIGNFNKFLVAKISTDQQALKNMFRTMSDDRVESLLNKFGELRDRV